MDEVLETKVIRCRYGEEDRVLREQSAFGWRCVSKNLLNRFGNPLPANERVSESDKREKCTWDLSLNRVIDPEKANKLSSLENEFNSYSHVDTSFGKGRITGSVFLTIGIFILVIIGASNLTSDAENATNVAFAVFMIALVALMGLIAIIVVGALSVRNRVIENETAERRKKYILNEAKKILG